MKGRKKEKRKKKIIKDNATSLRTTSLAAARCDAIQSLLIGPTQHQPPHEPDGTKTRWKNPTATRRRRRRSAPKGGARAPFFFCFFFLSSYSHQFYQVLPSFTGFYWVLPSFTGFYLVLLGFTQCFTQFYWVSTHPNTKENGKARRREKKTFKIGSILFLF